MNQKDTGVVCVYNAIGQKQSTIAPVIETLEFSTKGWNEEIAQSEFLANNC